MAHGVTHLLLLRLLLVLLLLVATHDYSLQLRLITLSCNIYWNLAFSGNLLGFDDQVELGLDHMRTILSPAGLRHFFTCGKRRKSNALNYLDTYAWDTGNLMSSLG